MSKIPALLILLCPTVLAYFVYISAELRLIKRGMATADLDNDLLKAAIPSARDGHSRPCYSQHRRRRPDTAIQISSFYLSKLPPGRAPGGARGGQAGPEVP